MQCAFTLVAILLSGFTFAQQKLPAFLQGTWKVDDKEEYEHWDKVNDQQMKGFSYKIDKSRMVVSEYLDIAQRENGLIYTAAVLNQNQGKGVEFTLIRNDGEVIFENPNHDFPRRITYRKISDLEVQVHLAGINQKAFTYRIRKQHTNEPQADSANKNADYNQALAEKLGADDYGMKQYQFVVLKTGTNNTKDKKQIGEIFQGHLANINKLVDEGKLVLAGPFGKNDHNYRGLFILNNIGSKEKAVELLQTDPAIKNGFLDVELYDWYGSAALPEYLPAANKIWKLKP